ncbi:MAG: beta-N-acetylhexosaminidase [Bosea sp.]|uniref:beta-N-acetylhexosaminidase n=1 Tax=Bosea sp. (in: a-proteobacteria) TaxID=1871050 RepID=UPI001AC05CE9|nr:beta-N-acetylhexosaminidase [Bosea sp. (in: a-proteobacteria)]MBN9454552.1 beta-N-acetylhexosaminidase [Bosea sp. (in: a-proteobacteria)]
MTSRAFIAGCLGTSLTADERAFFRDAKPWGFIVFKRNTQSPEQVAALTAEMRETVGWHAPILIDQEGGRVQRMGPPNWPKYPSARAFLAINDPIRQREIVRLSARLMAHDLRQVGIDVDCLPVLDVPVAGSHDVIGDRAYAHDPDQVARLGRAAAEGLIAGGVLPVVKHMPGHGRARADSHHDLPIVDASLEELRVHDFRPFRHLADMPMAMTAHLVFTALDAKNPATISRKIVREIMRGELGFDGLIMTDDISMKALSGSFEAKSRAAIRAGVDVILHCHGIMDEMIAVAGAVPEMTGARARRAAAALGRIRHEPEPVDLESARAEIAAALALSA